jgi:hypothetical protein
VRIAAVVRLQKSLILTLQLGVQDDSLNTRSAFQEALGGVFVRSIELGVVEDLARLADAIVKNLTRLPVANRLKVLEQSSAFLRQRDSDGALTVSKQRTNRLDELLLA